LVDVLHFENWKDEQKKPSYVLRPFFRHYGIEMAEEELVQIEKIEFLRSMCIVRKRKAASLGPRIVVGKLAPVHPSIGSSNGSQLSSPPLLDLYQHNDLRESLPSNSKVSLIIPFFNGSKYLDQAIQSALNQTKKFEEIIVVNDGSSPRETSWLKEYVKEKNLILIEKENGGQGSARNAGAFFTQSDYLCFLDQDDALLPSHCQTLFSHISQQKSPQGWVYANFHLSNQDGLIIRRYARPFARIPESSKLTDFLDHDLYMLPSASIIHKEAFCAVSGFDSTFKGCEDDDLFVRMFLRGYNFTSANEAVYVWRMHPEQTTRTITMRYSRLAFIKKWIDFQTLPDTPFPLPTILYKRFLPQVMSEFGFVTEQLSEYRSITLNFFELMYEKRAISFWKKLFFTFLVQYCPPCFTRYLVYSYKKLIRIQTIKKAFNRLLFS
jgi:glycosyltransferase involved in cell wall biosynthesis